MLAQGSPRRDAKGRIASRGHSRSPAGEIDSRYRTSQRLRPTRFARRAMAALPKDKLSAKLSLKVASFRAEYEAATAKMLKVKQHLSALQTQTAPRFKDLVEAANFIRDELYLDGVGRLDLFLALADQADAARMPGTSRCISRNSCWRLPSAARYLGTMPRRPKSMWHGNS